MTSWLRNVFYLRILHEFSASREIVFKISAISMNSSHHVVIVFEDDDYLRFTCRSYFRSRFDVTCSEGKHDCSSHQRKNMGIFPWGAGHVESPCALSRNGNRLKRPDRIRIASQAPTLLDPTVNRNSFRQLQFFSRVCGRGRASTVFTPSRLRDVKPVTFGTVYRRSAAARALSWGELLSCPSIAGC